MALYHVQFVFLFGTPWITGHDTSTAQSQHGRKRTSAHCTVTHLILMMLRPFRRYAAQRLSSRIILPAYNGNVTPAGMWQLVARRATPQRQPFPGIAARSTLGRVNDTGCMAATYHHDEEQKNKTALGRKCTRCPAHGDHGPLAWSSREPPCSPLGHAPPKISPLQPMAPDSIAR